MLKLRNIRFKGLQLKVFGFVFQNNFKLKLDVEKSRKF